MNHGKTVISQIMEYLPMHEFRQCVNRYKGDRYIKSFSCYSQFLALAFAQITFRESLRDIETCLGTFEKKLYHCGMRGKVSRNNLAHANETRNWHIYEDFAHVLINTARELYRHEPFALELEETIYALDATIIDLCLALFPWATFRRKKGAVKLHTLMDLRGNIPTFIQITQGNTHEVNILDDLVFEAGSFYIMDRAYIDFKRLYHLNQQHAFFVIRAKSNLQFQRIYSHPADKSTGLRCDQTIILTGIKQSKDYPDKLRRIKYYDSEHQILLTFLTNNFILSALTVTQLYKCRWQIELFFKWIKQHLRIKAFYGTSVNAVKTQIWIAICVYVLIAIVKKRLRLTISLYTILQILSVTLFEKIPIYQLLTDFEVNTTYSNHRNQLSLFNF
jgi:hypothetical protein